MDDRTPPGEHDVFNLLAAGPEDWVALHSLDLAPWNRGLRTEIDFVVIVPDTGILCVEVKSQEDISFDGHRWYPDSIKRSPFKQALDGRYTFRRRLTGLAPRFRRVPVVHCCIFPRAVFMIPPTISVLPWEGMDARTFRTFRSGDAFCTDLKLRMHQSIDADEELRPLDHAISAADIDAIVRCCLPVQKRRPDNREEITRREEEMEHILLHQQKPVLLLAELNDRLVVSGGAGTGKTLIAMEVARRASEKGRRVALLCYNRLVGDWMKLKVGQATPTLPNLIVGRAIRVLAEMTKVVIPQDPGQDFWECELPATLEERLTDPDLMAAAKFDYLVIDEAQDVLARSWLWQSLITVLDGGLDRGAFALFGDFEHQVLGERELMVEAISELERVNRPVRWSLLENCRNYRIIGDTAVRLAGFNHDVYSGYMRIGGSVRNYDIFFYQNDSTQLETLARWLRDFKSQGYKSSEITLLSFRADQFSAAARLIDKGYKLRPSSWPPHDFVSYASVHAFKGLENKVIILTDVSLGDQHFHRDLFYSGITRATECVRVLCDVGSQQVLLRWLAGEAGA